VAGWLAANPRVAGADVALDDLVLSCRVDLQACTKEVFGYVGPPCASPDVVFFCC